MLLQEIHIQPKLGKEKKLPITQARELEKRRVQKKEKEKEKEKRPKENFREALHKKKAINFNVLRIKNNNNKGQHNNLAENS